MRLFPVNPEPRSSSNSNQSNRQSNLYKSSFLLSNKLGGYLSLSDIPVSRYQGGFFMLDEMYKIVEDFGLVHKPELLSISKKLWCVERHRKRLTEKFFMPFNYNAIVYELSEPQEFDLLLDCRKSYDTSRFGNNYLVQPAVESGDFISQTICFRKDQNENRIYENRNVEAGGYELFLTFCSPNMKFSPSGIWQKKNYEYDSQRNSQFSEWYVYNAGRIRSQLVIFAAGTTAQKSQEQANAVLKNLGALKAMQAAHVQKLVANPMNLKNAPSHDISAAYACALNSLDQLSGQQFLTFVPGAAAQGAAVQGNDESLPISQPIKAEGIFAGYWWFFQFWARDEAISLKAISQFQPEKARQVSLRLLSQIKKDAMLSQLNSDLKTADAPGWLFHRLHEMHKAGLLNPAELKIVKSRLLNYLNNQQTSLTQDGFVKNSAKETWMDSIPRDGCRIEIQAMQLSMYSFIHDLSNNPGNPEDMRNYYLYDNVMAQLKSNAREKFWDNEILADGFVSDGKSHANIDHTMRPNIFIAYYIYPDLLSREEWARCFENTLKAVWLDWGGISTIDKNDPRFQKFCTGEDPASYHNGDSWYWLNNLAAICMHKLDSQRFKKYILKILDASTKEILNSGILGSHAELSSAAEQTSEGCLSQAWSNAMYIEMVNELF